MTIADNYAPQSTQGNGSTTVFTGTWSPLNASFFKLDLELISTGARTTQTQGSDYTLTFTPSGYVATMTTAPSALYNVIRYRETEQDQDVSYKTSSGFQGNTNENSFDKLTAIVQELQDGVDRSLKFAVASPTSGIVLPEPEASAFLAWNSAGTELENVTSLVGPTGPTGPAGPPVSDGDKGDIVVSGTGTVYTIDNLAVSTGKIANDAVTFAKMQNATAASRLLGSGSSGSGIDYAEITLGTNLSMSGTTLNAAGGFAGNTYSYNYWFDDFIGKAIGSYTSTTSGAGAATGIFSNIQVELGSGTTSTGTASIERGLATTPSWTGVKSGLIAEANIVSVANILQLSTAGQRFIARYGIGVSGLISDVANGVYFRYSDSENSGRWVAVSRSGGVESVINSSVAVAALTPAHLQFIVNSAGTSIEFFINGSSIGTIATNIPNASNMGHSVGLQKTVGTTAVFIYCPLMAGQAKRV